MNGQMSDLNFPNNKYQVNHPRQGLVSIFLGGID
jgi:hypothetical protein